MASAFDNKIASPTLSPVTNEEGAAMLTDESSNKLDLVAAVQIDIAGHSNLGSAVPAAGRTSQVTAKRQGDVVVTPGGEKIRMLGMVSLDSAGNPIPFALKSKFQSTVQTGSGSSQNIAHGLGVVPSMVLASIVDTNGVALPFALVEGAHDATNVKMTVTASVKYKIIALA